jgi:hypothetical protein
MVVTILCPATPGLPMGAQPTHPGPEYQLTNAGENPAALPGIQNHPKPEAKFQLP